MGPLKTDFCQESQQHALRNGRGECMAYISIALLYFAPSPKEGGPSIIVCWGPQTKVCRGPPNQSVPRGPQSRVCLGAREGVNPPLSAALSHSQNSLL